MDKGNVIENNREAEESSERTIEDRIKSIETVVLSICYLVVVILATLLVFLLHEVAGFSADMAILAGVSLGLGFALLSDVLATWVSKTSKK